MTDPIFILGCHRSGTSVVAGLLHEACGVPMGELMPATPDNPLGYFETQGIVDAHRDLLFQMERDWTCPPSRFRPGALDLGALEEQIEIHRHLADGWAMKDPRSMFLLSAWAHLGVGSARLVGVARNPSDTIRSIEKRDGIRQDRAEAIVEAYLGRLVEIAEKTKLPVVRFSSDSADVLRQVRDLAGALGLEWDQEAADGFFESKLVRNQSPLRDTSPVYERLIEASFEPRNRTIKSTNLKTLRLGSDPELPLLTHLGVRHAQQRHELWELASFAAVPDPIIAEILLDGARLGGGARPGVAELHQIEVPSPLAVGAALMQRRLRPHGVVLHGVLTGRSEHDIEQLFRSLYVTTHTFAEVVVDTPAPRGAGLLSVEPAPLQTPRAALVRDVAERCGWEHVTSQRVSPGRSGLVLRKRVLTDHELLPVVSDLIAGVDRIHTIDTRLAALEERIGPEPEIAPVDAAAVARERRRAERAEHDLRRLRNRRSVKLALAMASPFRGLFRSVRTWKKGR